MKPTFALSSMTLLAALAASPGAQALTADLGSDGSDGALNVTSDTTLPLPPDGIFHFTTVNIASGATLRFSYSGPLHPGVVILATGDVTINGTIDLKGVAGDQGVAGRAGPGGSPGGAPSYLFGRDSLGVNNVSNMGGNESSGPGLRPSGGPGGTSAGRAPINDGCTTVGAGGGGGGGALVLLSNTRVAGSGRVDTSGGDGAAVYPTGPSRCIGGTSAAAPGWDGAVRLGAPTVDLGGATVVARMLRVDAAVPLGFPTTLRGPATNQTTRPPITGTLLQRFPSSLPVATITAVNGTTVAPGSTFTLPPGATNAPFTVRVHVEGCVAAAATVGVLYQEDYVGSSSATTTPVTNLTGSDDVVVNVTALNSNSISTSLLLHPLVACGAFSSP